MSCQFFFLTHILFEFGSAETRYDGCCHRTLTTKLCRSIAQRIDLGNDSLRFVHLTHQETFSGILLWEMHKQFFGFAKRNNGALTETLSSKWWAAVGDALSSGLLSGLPANCHALGRQMVDIAFMGCTIRWRINLICITMIENGEGLQCASITQTVTVTRDIGVQRERVINSDRVANCRPGDSLSSCHPPRHDGSNTDCPSC